MVKNPLVVQEMQVRSLGQEDSLQKESATLSSTLAWEITRTEDSSRLQSVGSQKNQAQLSNNNSIIRAFPNYVPNKDSSPKSFGVLSF